MNGQRCKAIPCALLPREEPNFVQESERRVLFTLTTEGSKGEIKIASARFPGRDIFWLVKVVGGIVREIRPFSACSLPLHPFGSGCFALCVCVYMQ